MVTGTWWLSILLKAIVTTRASSEITMSSSRTRPISEALNRPWKPKMVAH